MIHEFNSSGPIAYRCSVNDVTACNNIGVLIPTISGFHHHPVQDSLALNNLQLPNEYTQIDPNLLDSVHNQWQPHSSYRAEAPIHCAPKMLNGNTIPQGSSQEHGLQFRRNTFFRQHPLLDTLGCECFNTAYTSTSTLMHGYIRDQGPRSCSINTPATPADPIGASHTIGCQIQTFNNPPNSKSPELLAATTTGTRNREVYASLDCTSSRGRGKIRVWRPPEVRWNETMQCAYVSPITGYRCRVRLNRGPDLERHLRTVHLRQEAQAVTDNLISRSQARLLPASWETGDRLDFACPRCLARFTRRDARNRHMKMKHGKDLPVSKEQVIERLKRV
ncbi:hypothetical protein RSOLAG1IB_10482 [Rhizoctonia solani AG-1 IB]|uniref:C2H2-type domain-containing protein n=1 Tax=Thanatephorus cucumeris (strain AG1-IB / isolate 7/3/14) TaxID=1108050 RepID=A0A0B7FYK6_THACB|nr:hypothetical protein RSOLAG1IB_10482 [Rhizoctonia solani AG-1 IB]